MEKVGLDMDAFDLVQGVVENTLAEVIASFTVGLLGGLFFVVRRVSFTVPVHPGLLWMCLAASAIIVTLIVLSLLEKPIHLALTMVLTSLIMYIFFLTPKR